MEEEIGKVTEEVTENTDAQAVEEFGEGIELTDTAETEKETVEETKEEQPKGRFMTDEEIDNLVMKKVNRRMAKLEAQKEKELSVYKDTENVLKSALGANNIDEANKKLREYYTAEGVKLPDVYKPGLTSREVEVLAKADAQDFIDDGYESMLNEANRLAAKEYKNLNERERIVFNTLAERLTQEDNKRNLLKLGATEDILNDKDFIDFKNQFNSKTPIGDIYNLYLKTRDSKTKPVAMGSMKDTVAQKETKDFYSPTDVKNLSDDDWNKPGVWERALASMKKWKE
ncbi:MAG TPA: hypothetical protein IAB65_06285 [Candidatus Onthocola stercorigallinarum]|nr:hypothetical protein [Candidatus Onthocola stercorigallinarum]